MLSSFLPGFGLGLSLILAVGPQNAFVLRQGLRGEHVFLVCALCALADALLIALGVFGLAALQRAVPLAQDILRFGGAAFLLLYALRALRAALGPAEALMPRSGTARVPAMSAAATTLVLTFANPHVYLDTVVLVGTLAARHASPVLFGVGAAIASFLFFFSLGYGARWLRPVFANPSAWRWLELAIAAVMATLGFRLAIGL